MNSRFSTYKLWILKLDLWKLTDRTSWGLLRPYYNFRYPPKSVRILQILPGRAVLTGPNRPGFSFAEAPRQRRGVQAPNGSPAQVFRPDSSYDLSKACSAKLKPGGSGVSRPEILTTKSVRTYSPSVLSLLQGLELWLTEIYSVVINTSRYHTSILEI